MKPNVQQVALLGGTFLFALAAMLAVWMVGAGTPAATPSPLPSQRPTPSPTPTPYNLLPTDPGSAEPTPTRTPLVINGNTPAPLRTPGISQPRSSAEPGDTIVVTLEGREYAESIVPRNGRLTRSGQRVTLDTNRSSGEPLWVTWRLPASALPEGAVVVNVDVKMCGYGDGDFWEVYGPDGGEPFEYEVVRPGADGCWSFSGAPGHELSVVAGVMLQSRLVIERIEYTITLGR
jgi:hypothetical protein